MGGREGERVGGRGACGSSESLGLHVARWGRGEEGEREGGRERAGGSAEALGLQVGWRAVWE